MIVYFCLKITVISDTRFKKMVDPADSVTHLVLIWGILSDFSGYHLQGVSVFNENVCFSTCRFVCLKNRSANVRVYCFFLQVLNLVCVSLLSCIYSWCCRKISLWLKVLSWIIDCKFRYLFFLVKNMRLFSTRQILCCL